MKHIGKLASLPVLALNIVFISGLLLAAYSPHINPVAHPVRACMGLTFPVFLVINVFFCCFWLIFRIKFFWFSLIALLLCVSQIRTYIPFNLSPQEIPAESFKLLSYNVMGFSDLRKPAGQNEILNYIKHSGADIICMQEYNSSVDKKNLTQDSIRKALNAYPDYNVQKVGRSGANALACYSKYPILSANPVNYKSAYNGSMMYEILIGTDTVTVINNHLESNKLTLEDRRIYEDMITAPKKDKVKNGIKHLINKLGEAMAIRAAQADAVAGEISRSRGSSIIVCGDFNDSPISYTHRIISEDLDDAFVKSGRGMGVSYNQNRFYFRIDNILTSKDLKAYNCTVDRSVSASDHYPIWCYISKRK